MRISLAFILFALLFGSFSAHGQSLVLHVSEFSRAAKEAYDLGGEAAVKTLDQKAYSSEVAKVASSLATPYKIKVNFPDHVSYLERLDFLSRLLVRVSSVPKKSAPKGFTFYYAQSPAAEAEFAKAFDPQVALALGLNSQTSYDETLFSTLSIPVKRNHIGIIDLKGGDYRFQYELDRPSRSLVVRLFEYTNGIKVRQLYNIGGAPHSEQIISVLRPDPFDGRFPQRIALSESADLDLIDHALQLNPDYLSKDLVITNGVLQLPEIHRPIEISKPDSILGIRDIKIMAAFYKDTDYKINIEEWNQSANPNEIPADSKWVYVNSVEAADKFLRARSTDYAKATKAREEKLAPPVAHLDQPPPAAEVPNVDEILRKLKEGEYRDRETGPDQSINGDSPSQATGTTEPLR